MRAAPRSNNYVESIGVKVIYECEHTGMKFNTRGEAQSCEQKWEKNAAAEIENAIKDTNKYGNPYDAAIQWLRTKWRRKETPTTKQWTRWMNLIPHDPLSARPPPKSKTVVWNVYDPNNRENTDYASMVTDSTKLFVFGDNTNRFGKGGTAAVRDEPNAMGVVTGISTIVEHRGFTSLEEDVKGVQAKVLIDEDLKTVEAVFELSKYTTLVLPGQYVPGDGIRWGFGIFNPGDDVKEHLTTWGKDRIKKYAVS